MKHYQRLTKQKNSAIRLNETSKIQAELICNQLVIDLQTYLRMCIVRLIDKNGIPFDMVLSNEPCKSTQTFFEMGKVSKENGN